ncbi:MAG TPA: undecaprenyl-diphosphate phosphatase [Bacillota bacterium]|nr:undecaprenyl-diphosphate phosphatase [Bacillota bacterium]
MPLWIAIVVLGIIEGITEFLPISSTGHLLIAEHISWLPRQSDLFNIVIQCGAVLAVLPLFPNRLQQFAFRWREPATQDYLLKIFVAFALTCVGGYILDKKEFKLPETLQPVAVAMFVGGVLFILVEGWLRGKTLREQVTWSMALAVGFAQLVAAVFPGTSRSGSTILIALLLGLNRVAATEFTFLVGIPTMLAAGGWKILKALHHPANAPSEHWGMVALGFIVSAVVSFIAVKWLLRYVQTHTFVAFGWYRIALALVIVVVLLAHPAAQPSKRETAGPALRPRLISPQPGRVSLYHLPAV